jgi:hypothetical protein
MPMARSSAMWSTTQATKSTGILHGVGHFALRKGFGQAADRIVDAMAGDKAQLALNFRR